jgi:hypothetical protein
MNRHSVQIGYIKNPELGNVQRKQIVSGFEPGRKKSEIQNPKSKIKLAERTGLEPASGFPR